MDMTRPPLTVRPKVARELARIDREVIMITSKSKYEEDKHLYNVIARVKGADESDNPYSVHLYNDSLESLNCGIYSLKLSEAFSKTSAAIND